jgi:AcrR family transcriptional regulator
MYHIKNDKRAEKSAKLICDAMLELISAKPFSEITVSDIQRVSSVSRSTFYRSFDCIADVLELMCDRGFQEIFSGSKGDLRTEVFNYWFENSAVPEALVSVHRPDIFFDSFRRCASGLESIGFLTGDPVKYDYFVSMITSVMMGILVTWIEHGKAETRDQLSEILDEEFTAISLLGILG